MCVCVCKAANKRLNEAFDALLAGESEYINDLTVIDEVFKAPMDQLGEDVISKAGRNRIFSTLVVIRNQHIQLFDFLKKSLADKSKVGISQYFYNIVKKHR